MANIPDDILHLCILPRLPVKSLTRFKSVSKSWQTLISCPDFIRLHHRHALSSDENRLLIVSDDGLSPGFHVHELDSLLAPPLLLTYPGPATCTKQVDVKVVASCDFFLLLSCSLRHTESSPTDALVLLNPSTGSYYEIRHQSKPIGSDLTIYGLYHDDANDDFKIVRITDCFFRLAIREIMVYTFKTNSWKLIERKLDTFYAMACDIAVIGHLLHTVFRFLSTGSEEIRICCFDIVAERWTNDIPLPEYMVNTCRSYEDLFVLDSSLLCVAGENKEEMGTYSVWVMKEYGVKESWVKLMDIDVNRCCWGYFPITYRTGSRHELLCKPACRLLCWYNIRDNESKYVKFDGYKPISLHVCKGSLVTFPGGQRINLHRF
ncbi:hypothetical protein RND81_08G183500 [Saponaria officinalis]|uniref:F-box domain-containing protein n=1 Tax=Saponaria officinalis TaxID=3572 RepID=A0AAW1JA48_SAPOF